jgi:hypothetical protein
MSAFEQMFGAAGVKHEEVFLGEMLVVGHMHQTETPQVSLIPLYFCFDEGEQASTCV